MAEDKKIVDVAHPGKSKPSNTSKPVIVGHGPILKDPMVVDESDPKENAQESKIEVKTKPSIKPLSAPEIAEPKPEKPDEKPVEKPAEKPAEAPEPEGKPARAAPESEAEPEKTEKPADPAAEEAKAAEAQAKHDESIEKLVESKQYFLPVNSVERRRSKRVFVLGVVVSVLLILAWIDIALDAGLIHIAGIKAVTHFFST